MLQRWLSLAGQRMTRRTMRDLPRTQRYGRKRLEPSLLPIVVYSRSGGLFPWTGTAYAGPTTGRDVALFGGEIQWKLSLYHDTLESSLQIRHGDKRQCPSAFGSGSFARSALEVSTQFERVVVACKRCTCTVVFSSRLYNNTRAIRVNLIRVT